MNKYVYPILFCPFFGVCAFSPQSRARPLIFYALLMGSLVLVYNLGASGSEAGAAEGRATPRPLPPQRDRPGPPPTTKETLSPIWAATCGRECPTGLGLPLGDCPKEPTTRQSCGLQNCGRVCPAGLGLPLGDCPKEPTTRQNCSHTGVGIRPPPSPTPVGSPRWALTHPPSDIHQLFPEESCR